MTTKPSWQASLPPSDPNARAVRDEQDASRRRSIRLILATVVAVDLAVVAWLVLGVDMPETQRWLVVGLILLSMPVGLFVLRRALRQGLGA